MNKLYCTKIDDRQNDSAWHGTKTSWPSRCIVLAENRTKIGKVPYIKFDHVNLI